MSFPAEYRLQVLEAIDRIDVDKVNQAIDWFRQTREAGRCIYVCGNGGSAATASHFACDLLKGASFDRNRRFKILALTDSLPTISAYANDVAYDAVFVEQLRNFAEQDDLFMGISGSGNSVNVLRAIEYANSAGCRTIALTGRNGGKLGPLAHLNIQIDVPHMGRIEDSHMIVCHMISYYFMDGEMDGKIS